MTLKAYGDDYGNRYAQVYSSEVARVEALATVNADTEVLGLTQFESGSVSVAGSVRGSELGKDAQSGSVSVTATPSLQTTDRAVERGSVTATGTFNSNQFIRVFESGGTQATGSFSVDEFVRVFESGGVRFTGTPFVDATAKATDTARVTADATVRFTPLVITDSDDPVDAFRTILSEIKRQNFRLPKPDVYAMWDIDPQQRLKNPDPTAYIWSPTGGSLDRFSSDGDLLTDSRTVEIMVMTYSEAETHRYTEDIIEIIGRYIDDNSELTVYEDIDAVGVSDERGDHIFGESNHYINTIEIETQRLRSADNL